MYCFLIYTSTKTQSLINLFVSYCIHNSLKDPISDVSSKGSNRTENHNLNLKPLLTNQFTGAWTHYTDTVSGMRTDHMVESFQRISIE